jgi:hypothetical protein
MTLKHNVPDVEMHCLVQDRYRAIRQELDMQRIRSVFTIRIYEEMIRYTIITLHKMCQGEPQASCSPSALTLVDLTSSYHQC